MARQRLKPILPLQERASWPDLSRPSTNFELPKEPVDARDKPGHDVAIPFLLLALVAALLLCTPALAQRLPSVEAEHYSRCMEEARQNPAAALDNARDWEAAGGGHPARHCVALA